MRDAIPHDAIVAAISLAPHIRAVREELETTRRVPLSLVQAINDAGLFALSATRPGRAGTATTDGLSHD